MAPSLLTRLSRWRSWFPVPRPDGRPHLIRWLLLEANRFAVTGALLTFVFVSLIALGSVWTFEMQRILTETPAVQTILTSLLSGNILLVSIVVSINSIVLSHDITSVGTQEQRVEAISGFREELSGLTESGRNPVNPASFLTLMAETIAERAQALEATSYSDGDEAFAERVDEYVERIERSVGTVDGSSSPVSGAEFGLLWEGFSIDYGPFVDQSLAIRREYDPSETVRTELDELLRAFELFAIGKEYFKTLYYSREISALSRTLLIVSLPAILVNAYTILAINAGLLPSISIFGLPPLLVFVALTFTISLAPYIILTAFMLRLSTVARKTSATGPFSLEH